MTASGATQELPVRSWEEIRAAFTRHPNHTFFTFNRGRNRTLEAMSTALVARSAFNRRIATTFAKRSLRPFAVQSGLSVFLSYGEDRVA